MKRFGLKLVLGALLVAAALLATAGLVAAPGAKAAIIEYHTRGVAVDAQGNSYWTGMRWASGQDLYVAKFSPSGRKLWSYAYSYGTWQEDLAAMALAPDGKYIYLTGASAPIIGGTVSDNLTDKIDTATGKPSFTWPAVANVPGHEVAGIRRFDCGGIDNGRYVAVDSAGIVAVAGLSRPVGYTSSGARMLLYSPSGVRIMSTFIPNTSGTAYSEVATSAAFDGQGAVYFASVLAVSPLSGIFRAPTPARVYKLDLSGIALWASPFEYAGNGFGAAAARLIVDSSGAPCLLADIWAPDTVTRDVDLVKIAAGGQTAEWVYGYGIGNGVDDTVAGRVDLASYGGIVFAVSTPWVAGGAVVSVDASGGTQGWVFSTSATLVTCRAYGSNVFVLARDSVAKLDSSGNLALTFAADNRSESDLAVDSAGNIVIGQTRLGGNVMFAGWMVKYSPTGVKLWEKRL